ncbi:SUMO-activating enzyme subunit 1 [Fasciola hepatica]|uniref:SUMO-activating enzyme subunit 1 n=1 Tax=Fasciola hepatica TaxID=6192 RepID=A0A4E0RGY2_FASHE|nr:SUMO-activating enzyme subunit 1 [Fasciola hepatica]
MCTISPSKAELAGRVENLVCISEAEAALYDRQIRLWGLEAQNKLKCARVLLCGMTLVGAELAKNLVLAGIASLDIIDDQVVTHMDASNFLIPVGASGENRAKASVARTQSLNPMVRVTAKDMEVFSDLESQLRSHDVIILTCECIKEAFSKWLIVDCALEKWTDGTKKPQVFCVCTQATFGLAFCNLYNHEFLAEHIVPKKRTSVPSSGQRTRRSSNTETIHTKKTVVYPTLQRSLELDWMQSVSPKRIPKGFFIMHLFQQYESKDGIIVLDPLRKLWTQLSAKLKIPESTLTDEDLECCCGPRVPAVSAVLGGVVAQEIVRAITAKGSPQGNWYFVDGVHCSVTVEWLPELKESA